MKLLRHVSFVDCPGHDILMATMLNGAAVMDAALLLIAANEPCPQPQTSEHLAAIEIMKLKHILVLQVGPFFSAFNRPLDCVFCRILDCAFIDDAMVYGYHRTR